MNRRNVFQIAAASVVAPAALLAAPSTVLAAPIVEPSAATRELRKICEDMIEAFTKHTHYTGKWLTSPPRISIIPLRPFNPMELKHVNCRCIEVPTS